MDDSREEYFLEQPVSPFVHRLLLHALTYCPLCQTSPTLNRRSTIQEDPCELPSSYSRPLVDLDLTPSNPFSAATLIISNEELMAEAIYRKAEERGWFPDKLFGIVAIRSSVGCYETYPHASLVDGVDEFLDGLRSINCAAGILTSTHVVQRIIRTLCVHNRLAPAQGPRKLTLSIFFCTALKTRSTSL